MSRPPCICFAGSLRTRSIMQREAWQYRMSIGSTSMRSPRALDNGYALAKLGDPEPALLEIREAIEEANRSKLGYMRGFMLGGLATVQSESGDAESAIATLDEALKQV